ncbi:MAG: 50S ribosomal protein L6 [Rhodospirillales bacterium]|nr:MAG: 50S ribosomal protein L6 [Rhodospirillales bacterium]
MSRVGKHPIVVPDGVSVHIQGHDVRATGKLGTLSARMMDEVSLTLEESQLWVRPKSDTKKARMMWGTARALVNNLVQGVANGFERKLEITGVGYRAQVQGSDLVLQLGYSHEVRYPIPDGIKVVCPDQTHIVVSGADKQRVGQVAAEIRAYRKVEPYKGKGIRYDDEIVRRKEGKKK